jgi:hypothetical protein
MVEGVPPSRNVYGPARSKREWGETWCTSEVRVAEMKGM